MSRKRRFGEWLRRWERRCKRICLGLAVTCGAGFLIGVLSPGGMNGTIGPIAVMVAFLSIVLAVLVLVFWVIAGVSANVLAPINPHDDGLRAVTPNCVHTESFNPGRLRETVQVAITSRGLDLPEERDPLAFLGLIARAQEVQPFTFAEAAALHELVASAVAVTNQRSLSWVDYELAAELLETRLPRVRVTPGITEALKTPPHKAKKNSKGFRAHVTDAELPANALELWIARLAWGSVLLIPIIKGVMVFTRPAGAKQPPPGWAISLGLACVVFVAINSLLRWHRKRGAEWIIRPTPEGFRAEPRRFAERGIEIRADECWTFVGPDDLRGKLMRPEATWIFIFKQPPGALTCANFDPTGTPWQAWLEEFANAVQSEQARASDFSRQASAVP
jgi:hypothetical protein